MTWRFFPSRVMWPSRYARRIHRQDDVARISAGADLLSFQEEGIIELVSRLLDHHIDAGELEERAPTPHALLLRSVDGLVVAEIAVVVQIEVETVERDRGGGLVGLRFPCLLRLFLFLGFLVVGLRLFCRWGNAVQREGVFLRAQFEDGAEGMLQAILRLLLDDSLEGGHRFGISLRLAVLSDGDEDRLRVGGAINEIGALGILLIDALQFERAGFRPGDGGREGRGCNGNADEKSRRSSHSWFSQWSSHRYHRRPTAPLSWGCRAQL